MRGVGAMNSKIFLVLGGLMLILVLAGCSSATAQPTGTSSPTWTPALTFTPYPTSYPVPTPEVVVKEATVEKIVEVVVTATPIPMPTATLTPTPAPTPIPTATPTATPLDAFDGTIHITSQTGVMVHEVKWSLINNSRQDVTLVKAEVHNDSGHRVAALGFFGEPRLAEGRDSPATTNFMNATEEQVMTYQFVWTFRIHTGETIVCTFSMTNPKSCSRSLTATATPYPSTPTSTPTPTPSTATPAPTAIPQPEYIVDIRITSVPDSWTILQPFFTKYITVFGINIFATKQTPDHKIIHAANVLAQYLDNDANGSPDNIDVIEELVNNNASLIMSKDDNQSESLWDDFPDAVNDLFDNSLAVQDLYGSETAPTNGFDASLEEVLHLITQHGYSKAYPDVFGEQYDSEIANYMDIARGGRFAQVPSRYPSSAWYSYDDRTCDYSCMVTEYFYWALTTLLDAQNDGDRCDAISHEWKLCTPERLEETDIGIYSLLNNKTYSLPMVLPDGNYQP